MKAIRIILIGLIVLGIYSCSIKKRIYQRGYSITWNKAIKKPSAQKTIPSDKILSNMQPVEDVYASITSSAEINLPKKQNVVLSNDYKCNDTIFFLSGDTLVCAILETSKQYVKYKKCETDTTNEFYAEKSKIDIIKKSNGEIIEPFILKPKKNIEELEISPIAIWASIFGVASIIFALLQMVFMTAFFGLLGIILGIIGLIQINQNGNRYKGKIACLIGILGFIISILILGYIISVGMSSAMTGAFGQI